MGYMVNAVIVEKIRYFKEIQLIPDDVYKTGAITQIFSASACLLECSLNDDCQTVVQEDSTCSLYNTTLVTRAKRQEENVLTVIKTETINDLETCTKMRPCRVNELCEWFSVYPHYLCPGCVPWCYGNRCTQCYAIPALSVKDTTVALPNGTTFEVPAAEGWIVLLRRKDGSVDFYNKLWNDYKNGFGDFHGELWLGNDIMHLLTTNSSYRVRFDLVSFNGRWAYAEYSNFRIGPESDNYRLYISKYSGNATNAFRNFDLNDTLFSTKDRDNDQWQNDRCFDGIAGWFKRCGRVLLTGHYGGSKGLWWMGFDDHLAYADMKIKQNNN